MLGGRSKNYDGIAYDKEFNESIIYKKKAWKELLDSKGLTMISIGKLIGKDQQTVYRQVKRGYGSKVKDIEKVIGLPIEILTRVYNEDSLRAINEQ